MAKYGDLNEIKSQLYDYRLLKQSVEDLKEQIITLEMEYTGIKATSYDRDIVDGGGDNIKEAQLITNIQRRDEAKKKLMIAKREVEGIEKGLSALKKDELAVITRMFLNREKKATERLMQELNCEQSQVYRIRSRALINYGKARYGIVEL